jgi:hypothetical protein
MQDSRMRCHLQWNRVPRRRHCTLPVPLDQRSIGAEGGHLNSTRTGIQDKAPRFHLVTFEVGTRWIEMLYFESRDGDSMPVYILPYHCLPHYGRLFESSCHGARTVHVSKCRFRNRHLRTRLKTCPKSYTAEIATTRWC